MNRILFAIDSPLQLCEGNFFREVLNGLRHDLEIRVIVTQPVSGLQSFLDSVGMPDGIGVEFIPKRFRNDPGCIARIRKAARKFGAELLHCWESSIVRLASFASLKAKWKFVANKFDLLDEHFWDQVAFRSASTIFIGHDSIQPLLVDDGCQASHIRVLKIGAPVAKFDKVAQPLDGLRDRFEIPEDLFLVGANAPLIAKNQLKDFLWATDLLQTTRSDFRFLLFGAGPQLWRLKRFARQSHADRKTIFMPPTENILPWFREMDLYWHGYEYNPNPFEIAAAHRGGCPTLVPRLLGQTGVVRDGLNGFLFDRGQRDQIARLTNALFNDHEKLRQLKESTLESSESSSIEQTVQDLLDGYRALCD